MLHAANTAARDCLASASVTLALSHNHLQAKNVGATVEPPATTPSELAKGSYLRAADAFRRRFPGGS